MDNCRSRKKLIFSAAVITAVLLALSICLCFQPIASYAETADNLYSQWFYSEDYLNIEEMKAAITEYGLKSGSDKVIIAVIDTGIILDHEIFDGITVLDGTNIVDKNDDVTDNVANSGNLNYHGTHVSGILAQIIKATGMENKISILPIKAGDSSASFKWNNVATAIRYAADCGADIINMSFTNKFASTVSSSNRILLAEAVTYAYSKGALCFAAAGNEGKSYSNSFFPASTAGVISVMAYGEDGGLWSKSNYSDTFDLIAPGENILSSVKDGYEAKNGTSMATPVASFMGAVLMIMYNGDVEAVDKVITEFDADIVSYSTIFSTLQFRRADLAKMLSYVPPAALTISADAFAGNEFSELLGTDTPITFTAQLYKNVGGILQPIQTDAVVTWHITSAEGAETTTEGLSYTLYDTRLIGVYSIYATVKSLDTIKSNTIYIYEKLDKITLECPDAVLDEEGSYIVNQTLGSTSDIRFIAYYEYMDDVGDKHKDLFPFDIVWYVQSDSISTTVSSSEFILPARQRHGTYSVYALVPDRTATYNYDIIKVSIAYQPISQATEMISVPQQSVFCMGESLYFTINGMENVDPVEIGEYNWYVNGRLYATGLKCALDVHKSGKYIVELKKDGTTVSTNDYYITATTKTQTIIMAVCAGLLIVGGIFCLIIFVIAPKYRIKHEDDIKLRYFE